ncbi:MAG: amidase, partial [Elusimicrobiota bacterium]|nr:amidase [Elusimicrobiota bacterium]
EQLRNIVAQRKDIGKITAIIPLKRGRSGYVNSVKIVGAKGSLTLNKENEIKKYLALGMLRSTYFTVQTNIDKGKVKSFIFYGGGWGHGVGLCQTGTGGRAEAGQNFEQILDHYYTDTKLKDVRAK